MINENKKLARRVLEEGFSKGDLSAIEQCMAPNHVAHDPHLPPGYTQGVAGNKMLVQFYRTAFPDLRFVIEDQIAEGDRVVTRWRGEGTQRGPLGELPATGRRGVTTGTTIDRIANGKIVESWVTWDFAGLMQQLGVMPQMERPKTDGGARMHP
jgi:steroid delta-isomerase-like uncharacterized protein